MCSVFIVIDIICRQCCLRIFLFLTTPCSQYFSFWNIGVRSASQYDLGGSRRDGNQHRNRRRNRRGDREEAATKSGHVVCPRRYSSAGEPTSSNDVMNGTEPHHMESVTSTIILARQK